MTLTLVVTEVDWRRGRAYFEVRDHYGRVVRCGYQMIHVVFKHRENKTRPPQAACSDKKGAQPSADETSTSRIAKRYMTRVVQRRGVRAGVRAEE